MSGSKPSNEQETITQKYNSLYFEFEQIKNVLAANKDRLTVKMKGYLDSLTNYLYLLSNYNDAEVLKGIPVFLLAPQFLPSIDRLIQSDTLNSLDEGNTLNKDISAYDLLVYSYFNEQQNEDPNTKYLDLCDKALLPYVLSCMEKDEYPNLIVTYVQAKQKNK